MLWCSSAWNIIKPLTIVWANNYCGAFCWVLTLRWKHNHNRQTELYKAPVKNNTSENMALLNVATLFQKALVYDWTSLHLVQVMNEMTKSCVVAVTGFHGEVAIDRCRSHFVFSDTRNSSSRFATLHIFVTTKRMKVLIKVYLTLATNVASFYLIQLVLNEAKSWVWLQAHCWRYSTAWKRITIRPT